jgi:hypothetical protein
VRHAAQFMVVFPYLLVTNDHRLKWLFIVFTVARHFLA